MFFKGQNSLTVTKSRWQRIPDDGSFDCECESSLRLFSRSSRQNEMCRVRRARSTWSDLDLQQVGKVRRVRSLQRLVGDERYLVLDALSDQQPVKWAEEWPCIRSSTTLTDHSGQIILRPLKFVNCRHGSSVEKSVAVIEPWCHDAACYRPCYIIRQEFMDVTKRADVVVAHTDDWINMFVKARMWIYDDPQQLQPRCNRQGTSSNVDRTNCG